MTKDTSKDVGTLPTHAYTYEVKMVVQVLAEDEKAARQRLDDQGGYVTSRKVELKDSVPLFNGEKKDK